MRIIEKSAKTEEDAINQVLEEIGSENKDLIKSVEVVEGGKAKFLSFGSKKVKVKVTVVENREQELISLIKDFLLKININVNKADILENDESGIKMNITTDNDSLFIGKRGKTLEAVQYLLNIMFNKNKEPRIKIVLDVEGYRQKRVISLQKLARNLALKVKQTKRDRILEPMNPYERKIIHSALQDEKDIGTESIGNGAFKKIKIKFNK